MVTAVRSLVPVAPRPRARGADVILHDGDGRPFNATATVSAWRGANPHTRARRSWSVTDASINALLAGDVAELRRLSRDITRKNPWAESALDSYTANAIGTGIVPRPLTEDDDLRRELLEAWDEFVETCDADGQCDFYGLQALAERSRKEGGECFVRLRARRDSDGLPIPLQLQVLEAEHVDPAFEEIRPGGLTRAGIEFDLVGRRLAYHMWREHPGDFVSMRNLDRVRVPADSVLHIYRVQRPGQIRGVPDIATVLSKLWELDKYDGAEVMRKQIAAMFAGFVIKPANDLNPLGADGVEGSDTDGTPMARLEPGTMQELGPGEDVKFAAPSDVGQSYGPFMSHQLRQVAAGTGNTYEQLTGDLSGVNFSSIRAGLIEFWRRMGLHQRNVIIFQFCRPVWRRFVEAAVLSGRVSLPNDPRKLRDLTRVAWTPTPGREYVDPEKEVRALIARMRAGLISRSKAVAEHGFDAEALDREIEADNARADKLGLRFSGDGRHPENGAAPRAAPPGAAGGAGDDEGETAPRRRAPAEGE